MSVLSVTNPSTLLPITEIPLVDATGIEAQLALASRRHAEGALPAHRRLTILHELVALMRGEREQLGLGIAQEGGKPLQDALVEVDRAINGVEIAIAHLHGESGFVTPMGLTAATAGRVAFSQPEPIGVVVAVSAFNHPLNLIVHQVVPAVAVGCPVIVKPASSTPLSCRRLIDLLLQAGLPEGWAQFCPCPSKLATGLVTDQRVAFFSFIGSARVGWSLRSQLAPGTRCALEHGGVAPVIVHESADFDRMLPKLLKGGYYHAGQVCVSVQRVYVPTDLRDEVADRLATGARALVVGDASDATTEVGPLIETKETARIHDWVQSAVTAGAELRCGGEAIGENFYQPTVLVDPPATAEVSRDEVFGPVVCVYGYEDEQEALARANGLPVAFQAAVFSQDIDAAMRLSRGLDASAVMINDHTAFRADWMPFAGRRASGYGIGGIPYTMHDMTQHKMVVIAS